MPCATKFRPASTKSEPCSTSTEVDPRSTRCVSSHAFFCPLRPKPGRVRPQIRVTASARLGPRSTGFGPGSTSIGRGLAESPQTRAPEAGVLEPHPPLLGRRRGPGQGRAAAGPQEHRPRGRLQPRRQAPRVGQRRQDDPPLGRGDGQVPGRPAPGRRELGAAALGAARFFARATQMGVRGSPERRSFEPPPLQAARKGTLHGMGARGGSRGGVEFVAGLGSKSPRSAPPRNSTRVHEMRDSAPWSTLPADPPRGRAPSPSPRTAASSPRRAPRGACASGAQRRSDRSASRWRGTRPRSWSPPSPPMGRWWRRAARTSVGASLGRVSLSAAEGHEREREARCAPSVRRPEAAESGQR